MEIILIVLEAIGELFFSSLFEIGIDKNNSKWLRYPLLFCYFLMSYLIALLIFVLAINVSKDNLIGAILLIVLSMFFIIIPIRNYKKAKRREKNGK